MIMPKAASIATNMPVLTVYVIRTEMRPSVRLKPVLDEYKNQQSVSASTRSLPVPAANVRYIKSDSLFNSRNDVIANALIVMMYPTTRSVSEMAIMKPVIQMFPLLNRNTRCMKRVRMMKFEVAVMATWIMTLHVGLNSAKTLVKLTTM